MKTLLSLAIILLAAAGNPIAAQCWNLIYEDNFDGTQLRSAYWTARDQPGFSESNGELQYHLVQNVSVYGGALHLVAKKENYGSYPYTSGWVDSKLKVSYRYGRIVSRMKLPAGKGMWPAFWLVPEGEVYGAWPKSGEIDIMENIGSDTRTVYGTFHTVDQAGSQIISVGRPLLAIGVVVDYFLFARRKWPRRAECDSLRNLLLFVIRPSIHGNGGNVNVMLGQWP